MEAFMPLMKHQIISVLNDLIEKNHINLENHPDLHKLLKKINKQKEKNRKYIEVIDINNIKYSISLKKDYKYKL